MYDLADIQGYEFFRPLVSGWLAKIEGALSCGPRKKWKEIADECHDEQTEVLTSTGWMLFSDLTGDELLGTVNLSTNSIEFQEPSRLTRHHRVGEMVRFKGKSLDALVTPGHRMVCFPPHSDKVGFKEADSLFRSDQLKLTAANWAGIKPVLPDFLTGVDPVDFAEWLGFYIAEGWCDKDRQVTVGASYRVSIAQKKPAGRRYYEQLAQKVGLPAPRHGKRGNTYQFTNKELCVYLRQFGGNCYTKRVPQWVKDSPQDVISAFLRGYVAGDGHRDKSGQIVSATASRQLADDLQELWLKVGRSASIRERQPAPYSITDHGRETRTGMSGKLYLVTSWSEGKRASLKRHTQGEIRLKYHAEHYDGMVYCATVPNGTLITRRNGIPLISGNCQMFYARSAAAMWDPEYTKKFWRNMKPPRFRISINKAFEYVAIVGPNLLWDVAHRTVEPRKPVQIPQELFAADEQMMMAYQAMMQQSQQEVTVEALRAHLMQTWLNYTPRELPGSGMETHGELAVVDALVKGRGVTFPRVYSMPGSQKMLTGCFRERPEDVILDPDFKTLQQCKWMALRHVTPYWELERRFKLPAGSLKNKATLESAWHWGELKGLEGSAQERQAGKTNDLVVWYEVWSKTGVGARLTGMPEWLKTHLEEVVGDYAYLALCPECPYPLNCPADKLRNGASDEEVRRHFDWPVPLWTDDRWPMEVLDFYPDLESAYPIPPIAPALGELKAMNCIVSWLVNRTYQASKQMWAVLGQYHDEMKKQLEDGDDCGVFAIPPGSVDDIKKICQLIEQKEINQDNWQILEILSANVDKRLGLPEMAYGRNEDGTQNRTAEETKAKQEALGVRPQQMQKKVVAWQSRQAQVEAILAWLFVKGPDTEGLLGKAGAMMWSQYIENSDYEQVVRQMNVSVAASSIRRPNRERDIANLQEIGARLLPLFQNYGELQGNYQPVNGFLQLWGERHDMDVRPLLIPEKDPNDPAAQLQQQMQQAEIRKTNAEATKAEAEAQANPAELKMQELAMEQQAQEREFQMDAAKTKQELEVEIIKLQLEIQAKMAELEMKKQEHQLDMQIEREKGQVDIAVTQAKGQQQIQMGQQQMAMQREQGAAQVAATKAKAKADIATSQATSKAKIDQTKAQSDAKVQATKAQAKAKPKKAA